MSQRKNIIILLGFVLSVSLITAALTSIAAADYYNRAHFRTLGTICQGLIDKQPETSHALLSVLKEYKNHPGTDTEENILLTMGYGLSDFFPFSQKTAALFAAMGFIPGGLLFLMTLLYWRRKQLLRIHALTGYLEQVNRGKPGLLPLAGEDVFSKLQDEIYKTVTFACQTRDAALEARNHFADNLSNIAHQLKTPITSISLSAQMLKVQTSEEYPEQIQRQLSRLTHLEEALLLLSRIDSGTLALEKETVDVFTLLMLAADNLQELSNQSHVTVDIPELGEMEITADLDWTMEALMNLMKNCMEHTAPGKTVHCSYGQNPLYIEIKIWDEGQGFAPEDIPRLFERFYRGQNAGNDGIGIGLSLAKEIIEKQNGTIRAANLLDGGACFEIHFY